MCHDFDRKMNENPTHSWKALTHSVYELPSKPMTDVCVMS